MWGGREGGNPDKSGGFEKISKINERGDDVY